MVKEEEYEEDCQNFWKKTMRTQFQKVHVCWGNLFVFSLSAYILGRIDNRCILKLQPVFLLVLSIGLYTKICHLVDRIYLFQLSCIDWNLTIWISLCPDMHTILSWKFLSTFLVFLKVVDFYVYFIAISLKHSVEFVLQSHKVIFSYVLQYLLLVSCKCFCFTAVHHY